MTHSRMAPRKLSDSDKRQIASIYCRPGETTSTLANKFGISSSTVSRVLKQVLPDAEYAKLMKWKRSGERGNFPLASSDIVEQLDVDLSKEESVDDVAPSQEGTDQSQETDQEQEESIPSSVESDHADDVDINADSQQATKSDETVNSASDSSGARRSRRRSHTSATTSDNDASASSTAASEHDSTPSAPNNENATEDAIGQTSRDRQSSSAQTLSEENVEEEADREVAAWVSDGLDGSEDYDEDTDEDWEDDDWEDDSDEDDESQQKSVPREAELTIHSFDSFSFAKPCYLVVDRMAELITCPLKDFSELGTIPPGEEQARTLPIFDNHRIARRFARRNQRIIKVPDGLMLNKTQEYLQAKGITRILFDGQVYALSR